LTDRACTWEDDIMNINWERIINITGWLLVLVLAGLLVSSW
jgi:hypothetical protein